MDTKGYAAKVLPLVSFVSFVVMLLVKWQILPSVTLSAAIPA